MKNNKKHLHSFKFRLNWFFTHTLTFPFRWIRNYFFCLKYPFWRSRNVWTDKPSGYSYTRYEEIPDGWRKAFGKQLSKDLKKALIKDGYLKEFRFSQIKEKWGELCLYNFGTGKESGKVIEKYELMSRGYCFICGKPARYVTDGWVSYLCEDCFNREILSRIDEKNVEGVKKQCRLSVKDMPKITIYEDGQGTKLDVYKEYGLDFYKLWDIPRKAKNNGKSTKE